MVAHLSRKVPLAELHCHLGAAVTPSIMWSIAHAQGIKLPTRDYWDFRDLITVHPRRPKSFDGYLQLFHWTELIQSSPIAVERAVYEVIGGAYRKNNVTTTELRFNPMKRNRGGEQDVDHIIAAAVRGMDRATLEYPVKPGLIFCLDRAFPYELNEILVEKAIAWRDRGVVGVDIAGPESATFRVADYRRVFRRARQHGLGITVHTGESGPVEEIGRVIELLEPDRIGHGVKSAYDPRTMAMLRERGIVLEICPTSNLNTGVVSGWDEFRWIFDQFHRNGVRYAISTDGPEMLKTYIRDELATLGRLGILSLAQQEQTAATALAASFVPNVSDVPMLHRSASGRHHAVLAAPVTLGDVPLADHVRPEHLAEQVQLRSAGRPVAPRDVQDRTVVLDQADPVAVHARLGDVALFVLDPGQLQHAVRE
jgi:adenosine deaminase